MSAAAATADAAPAPKKSKKKLFIIIGALVALLLVGGGAAFFLLKKKPAEGEEDAHGAPAATAKAAATPKHDPKHPPTFVPLEPFTVNLADRDAERYAQVGVTLELDDPKAGDAIKAFMPAIRNNILMVLAHKTAGQLLERDGKTRLATEIRRETAKALGYEVEDPDPEDEEADAPPAAAHGAKAEASTDAAADEAAPKKKKKKKRKAAEIPGPVVGVHFANFIIQ